MQLDSRGSCCSLLAERKELGIHTKRFKNKRAYAMAPSHIRLRNREKREGSGHEVPITHAPNHGSRDDFGGLCRKETRLTLAVPRRHTNTSATRPIYALVPISSVESHTIIIVRYRSSPQVLFLFCHQNKKQE